jgi:predicted DNA-binding transcriptional regulator YafY
MSAEVMDDHYTEAYGIFSGKARHQAVLRFTEARARWVSMETWHTDQQSRWLEDGRYELILPYSQPDELVMDLMRYGPDVEVVSPASLRKAVAEQLQAAASLYT